MQTVYVDARTEKVEELDRYFEEGNLHDFEIRIHALKSVSKTIGAMDISEEALALEKAAERKDADFVKEHYPKFLISYDKLIGTMKKILG